MDSFDENRLNINQEDMDLDNKVDKLPHWRQSFASNLNGTIEDNLSWLSEASFIPLNNPIYFSDCFKKIEDYSVRHSSNEENDLENVKRSKNSAFNTKEGSAISLSKKSLSKDNSTSIKSEIALSSHLDYIFKNKYTKSTNLSQRRDVLTKGILRAMKKFINLEFKLHTKRPRTLNKSSKVKFLQKLEEAIIEKGLITNEDIKSENTEFIEFVMWLSLGKNTSQTRTFFNANNTSINEMSEISRHYSHVKVEALYNNPHTMRVYSYFLKNGREWFMQKQKKKNQNAYKEVLDEISLRVNRFIK